MVEDDSKDNPELVPAISSQSNIAELKQYSGTVLLLTEQDLCIAADSKESDLNQILSRPWSWVLKQNNSFPIQAPEADKLTSSILLSEVNLGINETYPFHFETVNKLTIRIVIAPFFGPTVLSDAVRFGVLLVPLTLETICEMGETREKDPAMEITVDLEQQIINVPDFEPIGFETDPWLRNRLLLGLDKLDELRLYRGDAKEFRSNYKEGRPWLYEQKKNSEKD